MKKKNIYLFLLLAFNYAFGQSTRISDYADLQKDRIKTYYYISVRPVMGSRGIRRIVYKMINLHLKQEYDTIVMLKLPDTSEVKKDSLTIDYNAGQNNLFIFDDKIKE